MNFIDFKELGLQIQMQRKLQNLKQTDLAEKSGLSLDTIRRIEQGKINATGSTMEKVFKVLNIQMVYRLERR